MRFLQTKGLVRAFVVMGMLLSEASSHAANSTEVEVSRLKLRLNTLEKHYTLLCNKMSELAANCSARAFNCTVCPNGWFQVGDQCFLLSGQKADWVTSKTKCSELGGHLSILTSIEQHEAVENERKRTGRLHTDFWIGLTENEGEWKWVDNSTLKTSFWNREKSQPDNKQLGEEEGEDCGPH